jgi:hypothetical protein
MEDGSVLAAVRFDVQDATLRSGEVAADGIMMPLSVAVLPVQETRTEIRIPQDATISGLVKSEGVEISCTEESLCAKILEEGTA